MTKEKHKAAFCSMLHTEEKLRDEIPIEKQIDINAR